MRLKLNTILSLTLLIFSFILSSCIDEPTIEPVPELSSVIRVVNVSNDMNNIKVSIDDQFPGPLQNPLAIGSGTDFFDIKAGKKSFKVFDEAGTLIYSKDVDLISFELMTIIFAGDYDPDELLTSFTSFELAEGETYVSHAPEAGKSNVIFVHASAPVDTFRSRIYTVSANFTPQDSVNAKDTIYNFDPNFLEFGQILNAETLPGVYRYSVQSQSPADTVDFLEMPIEANFRYYMFIYGNPNNVQLFANKVVPPPIRPRD